MGEALRKKYIGSNKIFTTLGATNHAKGTRQKDDYYATDPTALEMLLDFEKFSVNVWECACGEGHLCNVLKKKGYDVKSSDLIDRGYAGTEVIDFLQVTAADIKDDVQRDIITNPPYKQAQQFIEHALDISNDGTKIAMLLKVQFLESKARRKLFDKYPPKYLYISSGRLKCAKNGNFENLGSSAVAYAWYIWEKGFIGEPVIRWFN